MEWIIHAFTRLRNRLAYCAGSTEINPPNALVVRIHWLPSWKRRKSSRLPGV